MTTKIIFAATFYFTGAAALSAQALLPYRNANIVNSSIGDLIHQLQQNALSILLAVVALMGLVWLLYICNACVRMNKKQKSTSTSSLLILFLLAAGMNVCSSSCTVVQQAQAADIFAAQAAKGGYCICEAPFNNRPNYGYTGTYNQYPYNNPSIGSGKPFCRQCGLRVYNK